MLQGSVLVCFSNGYARFSNGYARFSNGYASVY